MKLRRKTLIIVTFFSLVSIYTALAAILAMPLLGGHHLPKEMILDNANVHHGTVGQPLALTINGSGFDENTKFSLVLDSGNQQAIIDRIETFGPVDTILRDGQSLYLGIREKRIQQFDISNPDHPKFRRKYAIPGMPTSLAQQQETFWAATGLGKLVRFDMAGRPITTRLSGVIAQIATDEDGTLYVAAGKEGLMIFRPQPGYVEPERLSALNLPGTTLNVLVSGKLAFAGGIQTGLYICDVTNPSSPKVLATLPQPGIRDISARENLVLLATSEGLVVIDIVDPAQPSVLSRLPMGKLYEVVIEGDRALLATGAGGLLVVDITHPERPQVTGHLTPGDSVRCLAVKDDRAYLGTESAGLLVVDLNRLQKHSSWQPKARKLPVSTVAVKEPLQLRDELLATLLATAEKQLPINCSLNNTVYNETTAYFCTSCGLATTLFDGSTRPNLLPQPLAYASNIWISGATAYVAGSKEPIPPNTRHKSLKNSSMGLQIFDLGSPSGLHAQGFIKTGNLVQHTLVDRDRGYLAIKDQGVMIVDLSDPNHPRPLGMAKLPWPEQQFAGYYRMYLKDDVLYVTCARAGLQIFDVKNPHDPRRILAINTPGGWILNIAGKNNQLFTQNFNNDLQLYDISDAQSPRLTGTLDRFFGVQTIDIHDNRLRITFLNNLEMERALPLAAENADLRSNTQVDLIFPAPVFAGDYRLYAFNQQGRRELSDIITVGTAQK